MPVVKESNEVLTRGVPKIIFTASAPQLPGFFSGKLDLTQLTDVADEISVKLEVKYSSGGTFRNAEEPTLVAKQADRIFRFTPVEETYGYQLTAELKSGSPSATVTLELLVLRSNAPA